MKIRPIVSLTIFLSFVLLLIDSIVLYVTPQGRVAYWSNWTLFGLSKDEWTSLHINLGWLITAGLVFHIIYNWRAILHYMRDRARKVSLSKGEVVTSTLIVVIVSLGTYFEVPPLQWAIDLGEAIKDRAAVKYGEPPYGHAELSSLRVFARRMQLDLDESQRLLREAGFGVESADDTLLTIAETRGMPPQAVFDVIRAARIGEDGSGSIGGGVGDGADRVASGSATGRPAEGAGPGTPMPEEPIPGTGRRMLADLCAEYDLHLPAVLGALSDAGLEPAPDMALRDIAATDGRHPDDIYEIVRQVWLASRGADER